MVKNNWRASTEHEAGGLAFVGVTAVGVGIGNLQGETLAGLLIGAGAGFILMAWIILAKN